MIARLFEHRSGRIIALCRAILALVFFLALWIDPSQPVRSSALGYALLGGYLLFACGFLLIASLSWWFDHRLAWTAMVVDMLAFLAAVYFTEGVRDDFTSPFLAFFAFLMLAATIRWNWRVTAGTALVATGLYLAVGIVLAWAAIEFDVLRFGRRIAYMIVLALILIWFGLQRREQHVEHFTESPGAADGALPPLEEGLAYAIEQSGAEGGAIAWEEIDEPDIELRTVGIAARSHRLDPQSFASESGFGTVARLFSADRNRHLLAVREGRPIVAARPIAEPLADLLGIGEALALPFSGTTGRGEILLVGIPGVCADHVALGALLAREVAAGFDRHSSLVLSRESALARARDGLARDLHDSIAQSLAGTTLRLEGLRNWIRAGNDPDPEILQMKDALRAEQEQVRGMINRLRNSAPAVIEADVSASVATLAGDLSAHWGVAIDFKRGEQISMSAGMGHDLHHLLREAVANAVRHGGAANISIALHRQGEAIWITVADDGSGFAPGTKANAPRSIRERLDRLGGSLAVDTGPGGTTLSMAIPKGNSV
jgi:signal transduction histidine kinase